MGDMEAFESGLRTDPNVVRSCGLVVRDVYGCNERSWRFEDFLDCKAFGGGDLLPVRVRCFWIELRRVRFDACCSYMC